MDRNSDSPSDLIGPEPSQLPWQFSLRSLFVVILVWAVFFSVTQGTPGEAFWMAFRLACFCFVGVLASLQPSKNCHWIAKAMIAHFFTAMIFSPGDAGMWMSKLLGVYAAFDSGLLFRYSMFYRFADKPEPSLSDEAKRAIIATPIVVAVAAVLLDQIFDLSW